MQPQPARIGGNDNTRQADEAADAAAKKAERVGVERVVERGKTEVSDSVLNKIDISSIANNLAGQQNINASNLNQYITSFISNKLTKKQINIKTISEDTLNTIINSIKINLKVLNPTKYKGLLTRPAKTSPLPGVKQGQAVSKTKKQKTKPKIKLTPQQNSIIDNILQLDLSSTENVKSYLKSGSPSDLTKLIDKFKSNPDLLAKLEKKSGKKASEITAILGSIQTMDVSKDGIDKTLDSFRSLAGMPSIDLATLNPNEESYKLLTRPLDLQVKVNVGTTEAPIEKIKAMDSIKAIQISMKPDGTLNQDMLSNIFEKNYIRMATALQSGNKKQAAKQAALKLASKTTQGTARGAAGFAGLSTILKGFNGGGKNSDFDEFTSVFDIARPNPLLEADGKIPSGVSSKIKLYVKSLAKKLEGDTYKNYLKRAKKPGEKDMTEKEFNAKKAKEFPGKVLGLQKDLILRNQANIDANLNTIPDHRLGSKYAANYARLLKGGKINMSYQEYMDREVLPKMHPLMKLLWMIQEIIGMFNGLSGADKNRQDKLNKLKENSGIKKLQEGLEQRENSEKEKQITQNFLGGDFWKGANIKISNEVSFKVNEKGEDIPKENFEKRFTYFNGKHEKQDNFKKLLTSEKATTKELKTKGISIQNLQKIEGLDANSGSLSADKKTLIIKEQEIDLNKTETLDENISKAFEKVKNLKKVDELIDGSDIAGDVSPEVRNLIIKEDPKKLTDKKIKNLVERGQAIIDSSIKLDSNLKISDFEDKFFEKNKFSEKAKTIFKLKGKILKKEDLKIIAKKFDDMTVSGNQIKFKVKGDWSTTSFDDLGKLILALNDGKEITYAKPKTKARKKSPDKKTAPTVLTEEQKINAQKLITDNPKKLKGIKVKNIPVKFLDAKGRPKGLFKSLLKLDDKFFDTPLTEQNLKTITDKIGETNITLEKIKDDRNVWQRNAPTLIGGENIMFKAKGLKIRKSDGADMTFANIQEFIATLENTSKKK